MVALNIKNPETVALAKRLADRTGESLTNAVTEALREQLKRVEGPTPEERLARMRATMDEMRKYSTDIRTREEIDDDMYDEWGLPK